MFPMAACTARIHDRVSCCPVSAGSNHGIGQSSAATVKVSLLASSERVAAGVEHSFFYVTLQAWGLASCGFLFVFQQRPELARSAHSGPRPLSHSQSHIQLKLQPSLVHKGSRSRVVCLYQRFNLRPAAQLPRYCPQFDCLLRPTDVSCLDFFTWWLPVASQRFQMSNILAQRCCLDAGHFAQARRLASFRAVCHLVQYSLFVALNLATALCFGIPIRALLRRRCRSLFPRLLRRLSPSPHFGCSLSFILPARTPSTVERGVVAVVLVLVHTVTWGRLARS